MRKDGLYIGVPECGNYDKLETITEKTCCGNKKFPMAYIKCKVRGLMEAETECIFVCRSYVPDFANLRR